LTAECRLDRRLSDGDATVGLGKQGEVSGSLSPSLRFGFALSGQESLSFAL